MNNNIKLLLREIREKDVRELIEDHVRDITFEEAKNEITVHIDKRYAMNLLQSTHYITLLIRGLRKCFGESGHFILHLDYPHFAHEREMLIPYMVHY